MTAVESQIRELLTSDRPELRAHAEWRIGLGFQETVEMVPCQGCRDDWKAMTPAPLLTPILLPVPERTAASLNVYLIRQGLPVPAADSENWRLHRFSQPSTLIGGQGVER